MTWNASTTRRAEVAPGDVGCGYHEISHVGFFGLLLFDLKAVRDSLPRRGVKGTLRRAAERLGLARPGARRDPRLAALRAPRGGVARPCARRMGAGEVGGRDPRDARCSWHGPRPEIHGRDVKYCGGRFRVLKRMERLLVERTGTMRNLKDTVLLEGTTCDGSAHEGCDATCQHLWRELWLRRVDGPTADG